MSARTRSLMEAITRAVLSVVFGTLLALIVLAVLILGGVGVTLALVVLAIGAIAS